jgi:hypothetical protein
MKGRIKKTLISLVAPAFFLGAADKLYAQQKPVSETQMNLVNKRINEKYGIKYSYNEHSGNQNSRKSSFSGEGALDVETCLAGFLIAVGFEIYLRRT